MSALPRPLPTATLRASWPPPAGDYSPVDPLLPIEALHPLTDERHRATSDVEIEASLRCGFALTAMLVAAIGLYGLLAREVTSQRCEIGIRLALGAASVAGRFGD